MSQNRRGIVAAISWCRWLDVIRKSFARRQHESGTVVIALQAEKVNVPEQSHTILELPNMFAEGQPPMQAGKVFVGDVGMVELKSGVARIRYRSMHTEDKTIEELRVTWRGTTQVYTFEEGVPVSNSAGHQPRECTEEERETLGEFLRLVNDRVTQSLL